MQPFLSLVALQPELLHINLVHLFSGKDIVTYVPKRQVDEFVGTIQTCAESSLQRNDGQGTTTQFFASKACGFGL
jgi:hypothetical protein